MFSASNDADIREGKCSCPIGLSGLCGHVVGALYQLAKYKELEYKALPEDIAKTSQPQTFHMPRGPKIKGKAIQDLEVSGYSKVTDDIEGPQRTLTSTLYNPIRGKPINWTEHEENIKSLDPHMLILPAIDQAESVTMVDTKFGKFPKGSVISYQQKLEDGFVVNVHDGVPFPDLPAADVMLNTVSCPLNKTQTTGLENLKLDLQESYRFEKHTRLQSNNPLWYKIRKNRLTASNIGEIYKRKKDPSTLVTRLKSTRKVTTAAMRHGLESEPTAATAYATYKDSKVNLYPCGVVVSVTSPWLGASPDRKVYNPEMYPPFGLLEIKCPQVDSVLEAQYLTKDDNNVLKLKRTHPYYYQILTQLAVTGLQWCDLFVWCQHDHHCETIYFNKDVWQEVKNKVDLFFFNYFL